MFATVFPSDACTIQHFTRLVDITGVAHVIQGLTCWNPDTACADHDTQINLSKI